MTSFQVRFSICFHYFLLMFYWFSVSFVDFLSTFHWFYIDFQYFLLTFYRFSLFFIEFLLISYWFSVFSTDFLSVFTILHWASPLFVTFRREVGWCVSGTSILLEKTTKIRRFTDSYWKNDGFILNNDDFTITFNGFLLNNDDFYNNVNAALPRGGCGAVLLRLDGVVYWAACPGASSLFYEFFDEFYELKDDGFLLKTDGFLLKNDDFITGRWGQPRSRWRF